MPLGQICNEEKKCSIERSYWTSAHSNIAVDYNQSFHSVLSSSYLEAILSWAWPNKWWGGIAASHARSCLLTTLTPHLRSTTVAFRITSAFKISMLSAIVRSVCSSLLSTLSAFTAMRLFTVRLAILLTYNRHKQVDRCCCALVTCTEQL